MSTFAVNAVRWRGGWELHVEGEGVTQCRTLDQAGQQVIDYLETVHDRDFSGPDIEIEIRYDLDGIRNDEIDEVKEEAATAARLQREAARHLRTLARRLRRQGLSVTDTAAVLGVSRGRVSQLVKDTDRELESV